MIKKPSPRASFLARFYSLIFLLLVGFIWVVPAHATPNADDARTIEFLIEYVSSSDVMFVRNFGKHDAPRAASHIRKKYDHFLDEINNPEEFIELCASKSLVTGREYSVIDPQGKTTKSRDWLLAALYRYRADTNQVSNP